MINISKLLEGLNIKITKIAAGIPVGADMEYLDYITIQRALDDANLSSNKIHNVILVGGPTRMPIVQKYVEDFLGKKVERGIDPMECVAQGASIQAAVMVGEKVGSGNSAADGMILVDVTPLSLGTEVADGTTSIIIKRNTPIPIKKSEI